MLFALEFMYDEDTKGNLESPSKPIQHDAAALPRPQPMQPYSVNPSSHSLDYVMLSHVKDGGGGACTDAYFRKMDHKATLSRSSTDRWEGPKFDERRQLLQLHGTNREKTWKVAGQFSLQFSCFPSATGPA